MGETVSIIKEIAMFADHKPDKISEYFTTVQFEKGSVWAQTSSGGARCDVDLKIKTSVTATTLLKALRAVKGEVSFELDKDKKQLVVSSGRARARLPIIPTPTGSGSTHVQPKNVEWQECADLHQVERVAWCVTDDPTRRHLLGVRLGQDGMSATNGHAMVRLGGIDFQKLLKLPPSGIIVPPALLKRLPEEVWLAVNSDKSKLFVAENPDYDRYRFISLLPAQFPNVDGVVAQAQKQPSAVVNRAELLDCAKRASLSSKSLMLDVMRESLVIAVEGADIDRQQALFDFADSVALSESNVKQFRTGVDANYLLPMLTGATSDIITLRLGDELSPIVIEDGNYLGVVMPKRL